MSATEAEAFAELVRYAYSNGIQVQSNYARTHAAELAAAASLGLITTILGGAFGRTWRPTVRGLQLAGEGAFK